MSTGAYGAPRRVCVTGWAEGGELGLGATGASAAEPLYVVRIDATRAQVIVGPREALATKAVLLREVNSISSGEAAKAKYSEIAVRVRSTRAPAPALLEASGDEARVEFVAEETGVSPGQAYVIL